MCSHRDTHFERSASSARTVSRGRRDAGGPGRCCVRKVAWLPRRHPLGHASCALVITAGPI